MPRIEELKAKITKLEQAKAATHSQGAKLTFELLINTYKKELQHATH